MKLNRQNADSHLPKEGVHFAVISNAWDGESRKGDQMLTIELLDLDTDQDLVTDRLMLSGKGARFGFKALSGMGFDESCEEIDIDTELVGLRLFVAIEHEVYEGEKRPKVARFFSGSRGGYWMEDEKPNEYGADSSNGEATPF